MEKNQKSKAEQNEPAKHTTPIDDFNDPSIGELFGGSFPPLELEQNQVSPMMTFIRTTKIPVKNEETGATDVKELPVCQLETDGKLYALPMSAIFQKHWDEAQIKEGDKLKLKRYPDAIKKRGAGAGKVAMKVYAVKVYERKKDEQAQLPLK